MPTVQSSLRKRWGRGAGRASRGKTVAATGKKMALPGQPGGAKGEAKSENRLKHAPKAMTALLLSLRACVRNPAASKRPQLAFDRFWFGVQLAS